MVQLRSRMCDLLCKLIGGRSKIGKCPSTYRTCPTRDRGWHTQGHDMRRRPTQATGVGTRASPSTNTRNG